MSEHKAVIRWERTGEEFLKGRFSRAHTWTFDGGLCVAASSSPAAVPVPYSVPAHVDPEEAYVASISSCHMMTFLWAAYRSGFIVDRYEDEAVGILAKNDRGVSWVSAVTLHPKISYGGEKMPTPEDIQQLHRQAHEYCFIANSVKTAINVES